MIPLSPSALPMPLWLIATAGPGLIAVFGAGFVWVWRSARRPYLLAAAIACLAMMLGTLVRVASLSYGISGDLVSIALFGAAALLVSEACLMRSGRGLGAGTHGLALAGGLALIAWLRAAGVDAALGTQLANLGYGLILLGTAIRLAPALMAGGRADRALLVMLGLTASQFFVRALLLTERGPGLFETLVWAACQVLLMVFASGLALTLLLASFSDVLEEARAERDRDPLTGLFNRRGLFSAAGAHAEGTAPLSLIVCDLDRFKSVNDRFGHAAGDSVLRAVGALLTQSVRERDIVARIGGEEFVVVLANATQAGAHAFAERLRIRLAQTRHPDLPPDIRVTASLGIAERAPGESLEALFERADRMLYAAKDAGRNRSAGYGAAEPAQRPHIAGA